MAAIPPITPPTGKAIAAALALYVLAYLAFMFISAWMFAAAMSFDSMTVEVVTLPVYGLSFVFAGFFAPFTAGRLVKGADRTVVFFAFAAGLAVLAVLSVLLVPQHRQSLMIPFVQYVLSMAGARLALFVANRR